MSEAHVGSLTGGPLEILRTAQAHLAEVDAELARSAGAAELEEFLTGPGVVWVVGPPHAERTTLAEALTTALPSAVVTEHDPAALPPHPLWDVAVLVTPADRVLSAEEVRFVGDAAQRGQAVLVVVSRLHVLGDERTRAAGRAEIERYRLADVLEPRRIPWFFDHVDGSPPTADVIAAVSDVLDRQQDHAAAGGVVARALLDRLTDGLAARLPDRKADQQRLEAVSSQFAAHSAYLRGLASEYVARGVERVHIANDQLARAMATTVQAVDAWLATDGSVPWPDAEGPIWQAWTTILRAANALPAELRTELRAEIARVEDGVRGQLQPLGLALAEAAAQVPDWQLANLRAALARLDGVDLAPVLQRFEARARAALAAEQDEKRASARPVGRPAAPDRPASPPPAANATATGAAVKGTGIAGNGADGLKEVGRGVHAARALRRQGAARAAAAALKKLNSTPLTEELRAALLADVTAAVGGRQDAVVAAIGREVAAAARAECEAAVERLHAILTAAQDAVDSRHVWYGAYRRLLELRDTPSSAGAMR